MNIFVLDTDPKKAAEYHCNKHVVKMILEYNQLLCTSHWLTGSEAPYKASHINHPCNVWVRESIENYEWLCSLCSALLEEYTHRYGKVHKSSEVLNYCYQNKPKLESKGRTKFALAMPEIYKTDDCVLSYQNYYNFGKRHLFAWKNREIPPWINF